MLVGLTYLVLDGSFNSVVYCAGLFAVRILFYCLGLMVSVTDGCWFVLMICLVWHICYLCLFGVLFISWLRILVVVFVLRVVCIVVVASLFELIMFGCAYIVLVG